MVWGREALRGDSNLFAKVEYSRSDALRNKRSCEAYTEWKVTSGTIEVERSKVVGKKALGEIEGVASASFAAKREREREREFEAEKRMRR